MIAFLWITWALALPNYLDGKESESFKNPIKWAVRELQNPKENV